jgi:hypothetical protein
MTTSFALGTRRLALAAFPVLLLASSSESGDRFGPVGEGITSIQTVKGKLELAPSRRGGPGFDVLLDRHRIGWILGLAAEFQGAHPEVGLPRLVMVEITSGASGCPLGYRVIDVRGPAGRPLVSEELGNCNELRGSSRHGDVWTFEFAGSQDGANESWEYRRGIVSKVEADRPEP